MVAATKRRILTVRRTWFVFLVVPFYENLPIVVHDTCSLCREGNSLCKEEYDWLYILQLVTHTCSSVLASTHVYCVTRSCIALT
jgi:hypothetical protein